MKPKVLVVDDLPENLLAMGQVLAELGGDILTAQTGNEALAMMLKHRFAVVLLDVQMPGMDGFETAELMRSIEECRHVPIIFITAISKEDHHVFKGYQAGAVDYLCKPVKPEIVRTKVKVFLELELRRQQLMDVLQNAESLLEQNQLFLDCAGEGILGVGHSGRITFANQAAEKMFQVRKDGLIGLQFVQMLFQQDAEGGDVPWEKSTVYAAYQEGRRLHVTGSCFRRPGGDNFPVEYAGAAIRNDDGELLGGIIIFIDLTDRIQAKEELEKLQIQLRHAQKLEAIAVMTGGIVHDFNNVLTAMLGYTEMAKLNLNEGSPSKVELDEVLRAGSRAKNLVQQILSYSSRRAEPDGNPVQLYLIVQETLQLLRAVLPSTISIRENIRSKDLVVMANPTQIHQVLMNLCVNAQHSMREHGGVLEVGSEVVEVDTKTADTMPGLSAGKFVRLSVGDTGCGIDDEALAHIFDPFYSTKKEGEGTGLGLAVVRDIVTKIGGVISVESTPGQGTVFQVYFPYHVFHVQHESAVELKTLANGRGNILFVDDEKAITSLGWRMLEGLGYNVTARTSGKEAWEVFQASPDAFDLLITDVTMPGLTGMDLARQVRLVRPHMPVILSTGFSENISADSARREGISELLMKPFSAHELGRCIRRVLDN